MRNIIGCFLFLISLSSPGQKTTINLQISSSSDPEIIAVRNFWQSYLDDLKTSPLTNKESIQKKYWNNIELQQGFTDITLGEFPFYTIGELLTFEITKESNGFYRIRCMVLIINSTIRSVFSIYDVYAKKDQSDFKLYNHFFFTKPKLQHFQTGKIDFYYPTSYNFNIAKAKLTAESYAKFSNLYGNMDSRKVTYIIGNTFNEANNYIGFDFSIVSSNSPSAGYYVDNQNIILCSREDHLHEIIHAALNPLSANVPSLFKEGIATYYGGSGGNNYPYLIDQLKNMINNNRDIDLSKIEDLDKTLDNGSNYFYTIGAIFIDYALKIGGTKKVLALFQYSASSPSIWDDPISAIKKELGIEKDQIDSFLKQYVKEYKAN